MTSEPQAKELDIVRIYRREFSASHTIRSHRKCGVDHGHNYLLIAKVLGRSDEWLDFEDLKDKVDDFIDATYDHKSLGNMTCERLAIELRTHLEKAFGTPVRVELWETGKFGVETT